LVSNKLDLNEATHLIMVLKILFNRNIFGYQFVLFNYQIVSLKSDIAVPLKIIKLALKSDPFLLLIKVSSHLFNLGLIIFDGDLLLDEVVVLLLGLAQHGHRSHVDRLLQLVLLLLQGLYGLTGLLGVVGLEVVSRVGLAEELAVIGDPLVLFEHFCDPPASVIGLRRSLEFASNDILSN